LLAGDLQLGTALGHERLAISNLQQSVLLPAEGDFMSGTGRFQLGGGNDSLLGKPFDPIEIGFRFVQKSARLPDGTGHFDGDDIVRAFQRKPDARPRLCQQRLSLLHPELVIARIDLRDQISVFNDGAQIRFEFLETSRDFRTEGRLIVGRQGPADFDCVMVSFG
jgi:hypothetical protein